MAAPEFQERYAQQYAVVYDALFADGQAVAKLVRLASVVCASGLVDEETVEQEASAIQEKLEAQAALGAVPTPPASSGTPSAAEPAAATVVP